MSIQSAASNKIQCYHLTILKYECENRTQTFYGKIVLKRFMAVRPGLTVMKLWSTCFVLLFENTQSQPCIQNTHDRVIFEYEWERVILEHKWERVILEYEWKE